MINHSKDSILLRSTLQIDAIYVVATHAKAVVSTFLLYHVLPLYFIARLQPAIQKFTHALYKITQYPQSILLYGTHSSKAMFRALFDCIFPPVICFAYSIHPVGEILQSVCSITKKHFLTSVTSASSHVIRHAVLDADGASECMGPRNFSHDQLWSDGEPKSENLFLALKNKERLDNIICHDALIIAKSHLY